MERELFLRDDNESNNIYEQPLSSEIVGKLVKISREKGIHLNLYNDDELYVENNSEEAIAYSKSVGINTFVSTSMSLIIKHQQKAYL